MVSELLRNAPVLVYVGLWTVLCFNYDALGSTEWRVSAVKEETTKVNRNVQNSEIIKKNGRTILEGLVNV